MADVMISYSRRDSEFVRRLHRALNDQKREGWVDWEGIPLTADWWREICQAIESADTFLFVISPDSLASPICHLEIDHARQHNKRLVPIVCRRADPAEAFGVLAALPPDGNMQARLAGRDLSVIARDNWNLLARHNWLSFEQEAEFTSNFQKLISALDMDLAYIRQHTRLLVRAKEWEAAQHIGASLLRDEELAAAQQWLSTSGGKNPSPTEIHTNYIFESAQEQQRIEQAEREQQARELALQKRAANRLRYLAAGLALFLIVAIGLSLFAFNQFNRAQDEADNRATQEGRAVAAAATADRRAVESQSLFLAGASQELTRNGDPLGLTLALEAVNVENPPGEAQRALAEAAYPAGIAYEFPINLVTGDLNLDAAATSLIDFSTLSADGQWVVADFYDGEQAQNRLMIWEVATRTRRDIALVADEDTFSANVYLNPTDSTQMAVILGKRLETQMLTHWVVMMDREGNVQKTIQHEGYAAFGVQWGSDGHLYILEDSLADNRVRVWDETAGEVVVEVASATLGFSPQQPNPIAFTPNGNRLAYVAEGGAIQVVDLATGASLFEDALAPNLLAFNDDGRYLAIAASGAVVGQAGVFVVDLDAGTTLHEWAWPNQTLRDMAMDASGQTLAVGAYNNGGSQPSLRVWDIESGQELITSAASFDVKAVSISADGQWVLTNTDQITRRNNLVLWLTRPADLLLSTHFPFAGGLWDVRFGTDGQSVVVTNQSGAEGDPLGVEVQIATGVEGPMSDGESIASRPRGQSANGEFSAVAANDAELGTFVITLQNAAGEMVATWPVPNDPFGGKSRRVRSSNDGRMVVVGGCDEYINTSTEECGRANVLVFEIGKATPQIWSAHTGNIMALAWSPDGRFLVSADDRLLLVVWDTATGEAIRYFRGHTTTAGRNFNGIAALSVSPDGTRVASLESSGVLLVWRVDALSELAAWARTNRYARELTCNERLQYRIQPYCPANYVVPTSTPFAP